MTEPLAKQFDEANLRQKLEKFLHPTHVIPAQHVVNGSHVDAVICCWPPPGCPGGRSPPSPNARSPSLIPR
ncbi:hypothetical protein ACRS6B_27450 [Nocardia asteroides]